MARALKSPWPRATAWRQRGQAMVEYVIILPSLLLIIMGAIQMALIYQAKATVNYATFLAARQGALHGGKKCLGDPILCDGGGMQLGLAAGLTPLLARKSGTGDKTTAALTMAALLGKMKLLPIVDIKTLNPTAAWVTAAKTVDPYTGVSSVPNDNLMYRSTSLVGSGAGAMNIQDGNLLKIQVTYCFKLEVPFANQVIFAINNILPAAQLPASALPTGWAPLTGTVVPTGACALMNGLDEADGNAGRYLPIVGTAVVRMQSRYTGP